MASLISNPVAGAYTGTLNAVALGIMNDDGFVLNIQPHSDLINDTDQYRRTLIETIYTGIDWRVRYRTKEWNTGMQAAFSQYGAQGTNPAPGMSLGIIGRKGSGIAQALILTATTGTPAATSPATLTATQALLAPETNIDMRFTAAVREVPIEHVCLPYSTTTGGGTFVVPWTCS